MPAHLPVLPTEVVTWLQPARGGTFVDTTVGLGGHAALLLDGGATRLLGIDRDPAAVTLARDRLAAWGDRATCVQANHDDVAGVLDAQGITSVEGALADLGVSSMQLDQPGRGFSFQRDEPLDMRMDSSSGPTAADLLAEVDERDLADVIFRYGEERRSRAVARAIVAARAHGRIATTGQLAALVRRVVGRGGWQRIDPATRTFQALRIWVNGEIDGLEVFLRTLAGRLAPGGRLVVITFHSLEDRPVKHTFRDLATGGEFVVLTKKPVIAGEDEQRDNPRSRSAKLRVIRRTG